MLKEQSEKLRKSSPKHAPLLLWGILFIFFGMALYLFGILLSIPRVIFGLNKQLLQINEFIIWYSGAPILIGICLSSLDLFWLLIKKRNRHEIGFNSLESELLTVVLTAYNDEQSIGLSVKDFLSHPLVKRVVVVDNNSTDLTATVAREAGALVELETIPGYGSCVFRCLTEALKYKDTSLTLLCEGDMTFRAHDISKFLAYIPHADIVVGTRIVEQLRSPKTQLSTFMYYGNFFVGKLLEAKHLGKGTFTDVGTTYKLCRNESLQRVLPKLNPAVNLAFNAHFLDCALFAGERVVECPITFHSRIGLSKGGNVNNLRALLVGMSMLRGIIFSWKK